eukprot:4433919-Lingulodinium_polyedra.AAC.1
MNIMIQDLTLLMLGKSAAAYCCEMRSPQQFAAVERTLHNNIPGLFQISTQPRIIRNPSICAAV